MTQTIINILFAIIFGIMIVIAPRTLIVLIVYRILRNTNYLSKPVFILIIISLIVSLIYDIMEFYRNWLTNN